MACPVGAHIRRANPRDIIGPDPDTALRLSKMHRIIRRGRPYGPRRGEGKPDARRGIAFIALNADIAGQFEMIQHSWLNNPNFGGLYAGCDPIGHVTHPDDEFAVQQRPANLHVRKPRPFVTVRGGAYFFLPGLRALLRGTRSAPLLIQLPARLVSGMPRLWRGVEGVRKPAAGECHRDRDGSRAAARMAR